MFMRSIARTPSTSSASVHRDKPAAPGRVVDLASRRKRCPANAPTAAPSDSPAEDGLEYAASHWDGVFGAAGLDFTTPVPPADMVPVITAELERLLGGLVTIREGGGPMDLPPNPEAGMDVLSAMECAGLLRDLCAVAQRGRARGRRPE
jgi:hypothetical protein